MPKPIVSHRLAAAIVVLCSAAFAAINTDLIGLASANFIFAPQPDFVEKAVQPMTPGTCQTAGPIEAEASAGTAGPTAYATLKAAFDAINAGTHRGTITLDVCGNTNETVTAVLNASGAGSASYTAVTISPAGGAARTISGAITAGSPLIDLNGADNVTFDGLNTGGNSLTLSNTTASATSGTSTIKFEADAAGNAIKNSIILGSGSMDAGTNGGNIYFAAGAINSGNDNNTIANNDIGPAGSNLPTKAIYSSGTTTNMPRFNSGIAVTGNNIHDFFGAAVQSAGIYVSSGTTDWTISNNKFYQTAARTQTTGSIHAAIQIASSNANNFVITGNTIGFAAGAGTGVYSFVGLAGSRFYPIYISSHGTTTASSIQNNTIKAVAVSGALSGTNTSAPFAGILVASGLVNVGNTTGNTIGSTTAANSVTFTSSSTSASDVYGIYYAASNSVNISNNNIGGIGVTNSDTGAVDLYGVRANTGASVTNTMNGNTVGFTNAPLTNSAAATASSMYGVHCQAGVCSVSGNTVRNLSMAAGNTGAGQNASLIGLWIDNPSAAGNTVSGNVVSDLSNVHITANASVTGIQYNGGSTGTNVVERNFVYNLSVGNATSTSGTVNGIGVQGGTTVFKNNIVALGNGVTAGNQFSGINETVAGTDSFYHNSVYIGGTAVVGSASTFALQSTVTASNRNYRNNIFYNGRSNGTGTGKHYAVRIGGTAANPAGLTINNNVYLANGAGRVLGLFNGADTADLAAWQTAVGQDAASFEANPKFVDPTNSIPDLHIDAASPTVVDANGSDVGVTNDFDGDVRDDFTPVDIGADAGNFASTTDVTRPVITYTPLANTASTAARTLSVRVTDDTGVAIGALRPRVYFRVSAGSYSSAQCNLTGGNSQDGTYSCVINASGAVTGDSVFYFVVAQDDAGNIASNPAGAIAVNVNTVRMPPASPNRYNIVTPTSGTVNVGSSETITSLTNAGGLFDRLNNGVVTANLIVNLTSDLTSETGAVQLNQFVEEGSGGYTLVIQSSGAARLIEGSNAASLITLNGADRVTFSGVAFGPLGLTIRNKDNAGSTITFVGDASNNSITGVSVEGGSTSATAGVVTFAGGVNTGNDGNSIGDSVVRDRSDAAGVPVNLVYSAGSSTSATNGGNTIANSTLKNFTGTAVLLSGSGNSNFNSDWTITSNTISEEAVRSTALTGIVFNSLGTNTVSRNVIRDLNTSGDVTGILLGDARSTAVSRNRIYSIPSTAGSTATLAGIVFIGAQSRPASATLDNNMVSIMPGFTNAQAIYGIRDAAVAGNTIKAYYNSVLVGGTASGSASWAYVRGTSAPTATTLTNNIFFNNRTGGSVNHFAVGDQSANTGSWSSDRNVFVGTGTTAANFFDYGTNGSGTAVDLTAWKAGPPARDANSQADNPTGVFAVGNVFLSLTDLHVNTISTNPASNSGTPIAGFTTDFDGQTRNATTPDKGADEFAPEFPGTLQFGAATYSVAENVATVTLSVTRTGGTDRAVSAQVTFAGGSATGGASCSSGVDYVNTPKTVNFAAGSSTAQTFTVAICDDSVWEDDEAFVATLGNFTGGATGGSPTSANVTIVEDDPVPPSVIQLSPNNIDFPLQAVGVPSAGVTVTINNNGNGPLLMGTPAFGGSNPGDFSLVNSPAGKRINPHSSYQFQVRFTPGASGGRSATLTLPNNDPTNLNPQMSLSGTGFRPGTFQWQLAAYSSGESTPGATLTVLRSNGDEGPVTLNYSLTNGSATGGGSCSAGVDFVNTTNVLQFAGGESSKTVLVPFCSDLVHENDETLTATISSVSNQASIGSQNSTTITIVDDDPAGVIVVQTQATTDVAEGGATDDYSLKLISQPTANVTIAVNSGTQLTASPQSLTFTPANWNTPQFVTLNAIDDNVYQGNRTATVSHTATSTDTFYNGITVASVDVNITDNDTRPSLEFTTTSSSVAEGGGQIQMSVTRTGAAGNVLSLRYDTSNGSATGGASCQSGTDFVNASGTLNWAANDTTNKTITIQICQDTVAEPGENFGVMLSAPTGSAVLGGQSSHFVSIVDDESPVIEFQSAVYSAAEGVFAAATVNRLGDPNTTASVSFTTSNGTAQSGTCGNVGADYESANGALTFGPGQVIKLFSVPLCTDTSSENPAETINVTLSNPTGASLGSRNTATIRILDIATEYRNPDLIEVNPARTSNASTIEVVGYPTTITGVRVTLYDVNATLSENLDVLLVGPNGAKYVLMADTGGGTTLTGQTLTFEDAATDRLPDSTQITDGRNYRPTTCTTPIVSFGNQAPGGPYLEPGCGAGGGATLVAAFGGTNPSGMWNLYIRDDSTPLAFVSNVIGGGWGIEFIPNTAGTSTVSGRVTDSGGNPIQNATVKISGGGLPQPIMVATGSFGRFRFDRIPNGQTYSVTVSARRQSFAVPTRPVSVTSDVTGVDFVAEP